MVDTIIYRLLSTDNPYNLAARGIILRRVIMKMEIRQP